MSEPVAVQVRGDRRVGSSADAGARRWLRLRYAKRGKIRFTSHRDTARVWERAMRRAAVPVAMSAGFTPRPRLSFGLALPTGAESVAEYLDVEVTAGAMAGSDVDELPGRLGAVLPVGFEALAVAEREAGAGSLQESVTTVTWELEVPGGADVEVAVTRLLASTELPLERERKGERRIDDIRPAVRSLAVGHDDPERRGSLARELARRTLVAEVATVGRGLRPAELATVAFPGADATGLRTLRTHQWIEHDGDRREVIALPVAAPAPLVGA
jgi:radical SAM-linked protein